MSDAKPTTGMPAGDARREQQRVNADALAEEAAARASAEGLHAIDPSKMEVERDAAFEIVGADGTENRLAVPGAQPGYRYKRIRGFSSANPTEPDTEQWNWYQERYRIRDRATGKVFCPWQLVNDAKDPEDRDSIHVSAVYGAACRRRLDTILIRCREDWARLCDQYDTQVRAEREGRSVEGIVDAANHLNGIRATNISTSSPDDYMRMRRGGMDVSQVTRAIKEGTVAGMPAPGR